MDKYGYTSLCGLCIDGMAKCDYDVIKRSRPGTTEVKKEKLFLFM
jgi:hypothetical protein